jgi:hypothetical protein
MTTALVDLDRFFSFLMCTQSLGLIGRGISPSQGRYLHTEQHKYRINSNIHPCLEWDSNPRSHCSSGRRRFMPFAVRHFNLLWRILICPALYIAAYVFSCSLLKLYLICCHSEYKLQIVMKYCKSSRSSTSIGRQIWHVNVKAIMRWNLHVAYRRGTRIRKFLVENCNGDNPRDLGVHWKMWLNRS